MTGDGHQQAARLGRQLRRAGISIERVLCSPARRTQQTLHDLDLEPSPEIDIVDRLYNAGSDEIIAAIRQLPDEAATVLVVGHAPGVPSVAYELADPATSDADAAATIEHRYPAGTLATLRVTGGWSELATVALVDVWLP